MIVEYAQNEILISPKSPRIYHSKKDDIPVLKYPSSNLNPDASTFTSSTSDYYSQSDRPSSRSSSERSNCLSPSILSATLPLSYSDGDDIHDDEIFRKNIYDKGQSLNIFIGDKILNLYGKNVDVNNNNNNHQISFDGKIGIIFKV
jgi:hypothetical protein